MKDEALMTKQAQLLKNSLSSVWESHARVLEAEYPHLSAQLRKVLNRSKEYADRSFVILVAGPVKSGKSTFVNLVANAFVSPTHFLECTVRPSIISYAENEEDRKITVYRSNDRNRSREEQVDAVIDCLRGIASADEIPDVTREEMPLTRENIENHIALDFNDISSDETLISTIGTSGGNLLVKDVYIIDMPGFDGSRANLDDPLYQTIAARADLIILVQSSNSAITKVSDDFFRLLESNNRRVPVCLVHNIFDSAFWRNGSKKEESVREHLDYAVSKIKGKGFNLDARNAYALNLGMVWDWRTGDFEGDAGILEKAVAEYGRVEKEMYGVLMSQRDAIRIRNVIERTHQQLEILIGMLRQQVEANETCLVKYEAARADFESLKKADIEISPEVSVDYQAMKDEVISLYTLAKKSVAGKNTVKEARAIVGRFISDCAKAIARRSEEALKFISLQASGESVTIWRSEIAGVLRSYGAGSALPQVQMPQFRPMEVDLSALDESRIVPWALFRYRNSKVNEFLHHVCRYIVGPESKASQEDSYITFFLPAVIADHASERSEILKEAIVSSYMRFIGQKQAEILQGICPEPKKMRNLQSELKEVLSGLEDIYRLTDETLKI